MNTQLKWSIRLFYVIWLIILFLLAKPPFNFLVLNTFLAYIPIELSFHIGVNKPKSGILFWPLVIIWLLFYPNAPYLLTDLFHLSLLQPYGANGLLRLDLNMWLNFTLLIVSAIPATIISMWGVKQINDGVISRLHMNQKIAPLGITIISILSAIGIFIGRFLRIHTVYLFITPELFIKPILNMWNQSSIIFIGLLTIVQLVIYWALFIFKNGQINQPTK